MSFCFHHVNVKEDLSNDYKELLCKLQNRFNNKISRSKKVTILTASACFVDSEENHKVLQRQWTNGESGQESLTGSRCFV